jgi:hypothetical protein
MNDQTPDSSKPIEDDESMPKMESSIELKDKSLEETTPMEGSAQEPMERSMEEPMEGSMEEPMEEPMEGSMEGSMEEPMEGSMEEPMEGSMEESPVDQGEMTSNVMESEKEASEQDESEEDESVISETKPEKAQIVLKKASNFRQKLTKTKRKLTSLDDSQKEKIRNDLVNEFVSILKLYKHKTTRKKYIRRLNGLRTAFNQSLNKLNGTTRQRRRKSKKQQAVYSEEAPMSEEEVPENQ